MEQLLDQDFCSHYGVTGSSGLFIQTLNDPYFELEDVNKVLTIFPNHGTARFQNPRFLDVEVIDWDRFMGQFPASFQSGKERCDAMIVSVGASCFSLHELKDRKPKSKVVQKAVSQLVSSLQLLLAVPSIHHYSNQFASRKCCYWNKQPVAPTPLQPTISGFNRVNQLVPQGMKLSNPSINALGFDYYEFSDPQVFVF